MVKREMIMILYGMGVQVNKLKMRNHYTNDTRLQKLFEVGWFKLSKLEVSLVH